MNTLIFQNLNRRLNAIPRWGVALFISILPSMMSLILIRFYLNADILNFAPAFLNDQTWYWHQTLSFAKVGFAGGYYLINEAVAPWAFFKFSSAGPLFPVIFGVIGHFIGWGWVTGVALNMLILTVAILIFIYLAQLDRLQMVLTGLVLLVCGPVMIYLPTYLQEPLHQAGAIILAGLFYRLWQGKMSWRLWWIGLFFLLFISLLRFSFVILLPPYFLVSERKPSVGRIIYAFVVGGVLAISVYMAVSAMSSPGHNVIIERLSTFNTSPLAAIQDLVTAALKNLDGSFLGSSIIQNVSIIQLQGIQIAVILITALAFAFPAPNVHPQTHTKPLENGFHFYNLGVIILISIFMYLSNGFFKVFGIHVLLSLMLLIAFRRLATITVIIAVSILMIGTFAEPYRDYIGRNVTEDRQAIETTRQEWSKWISYEPDAEPWCNTILFPQNLLNVRILYVPAGMGVTFYTYLHPTAKKPIHSHYLLLDQAALDDFRKDTIHLQPIAVTAGATLYRNLDATCPADPQPSS
jgi:hypothetical protein